MENGNRTLLRTLGGCAFCIKSGGPFSIVRQRARRASGRARARARRARARHQMSHERVNHTSLTPRKPPTDTNTPNNNLGHPEAQREPPIPWTTENASHSRLRSTTKGLAALQHARAGKRGARDSWRFNDTVAKEFAWRERAPPRHFLYPIGTPVCASHAIMQNMPTCGPLHALARDLSPPRDTAPITTSFVELRCGLDAARVWGNPLWSSSSFLSARRGPTAMA